MSKKREKSLMEEIDLDAIRKRDRDYDDTFEAQTHLDPKICSRMVAWPVQDRRDLLAYVDALREAAGKVTCRRCWNRGIVWISTQSYASPCPDCTDLRALLAASQPCQK